MIDATPITLDELAAAEMRSMAFVYVSEAFAEATLDGIEIEAVAEAAFCAAFRELVAVYGEECATRIAKRLPERVEAGEFSASTRQ
jgi:hypothetical protein